MNPLLFQKLLLFIYVSVWLFVCFPCDKSFFSGVFTSINRMDDPHSRMLCLWGPWSHRHPAWFISLVMFDYVSFCTLPFHAFTFHYILYYCIVCLLLIILHSKLWLSCVSQFCCVWAITNGSSAAAHPLLWKATEDVWNRSTFLVNGLFHPVLFLYFVVLCFWIQCDTNVWSWHFDGSFGASVLSVTSLV